MQNPITIHSFPLSGHAHRVELFASIAGIKYEINPINLAKGEQKQAAFLALNPDGQVPTIQDGEVTLSDANAILIYLARKYASDYLPQDLVHEAQIQKFLTLAAGEIAFGPAAARLINVFKAPLDPKFASAIAERALGKLERHMENKQFLVADRPTIADIAIYSYVAHAPEGGISLEAYPNTRRLLANIEALEGFKPMQTTQVGLLAE
ncbi:MAG: glutathione S-transferase [Oceanospirillaceae bacterium]|nr:glutathione S-transferase [Oceanospirillaceae bacterium]